MRIAVLVKQVPDTWNERRLDPATGVLDRASSDLVIDEINERALEAALVVKDSDNTTEIVVITMGPASATEVLRKGLSMGADSAVHILDSALTAADYVSTAATLAAILREGSFDLVIAGNQSTDGRGGVIPAMLAEHLDLPLLSNLDTIEITESDVRGERGIEGATQSVHAALPAIISVTERANEPRFPTFKGIMGAKRKPVDAVTAGPPVDASHSVIVTVAERPARNAGIRIIDDGTAATQLVDFLVAGRLI
ncbi:MAG TPA: electron transfer flavoprotein subunit beta [Microbacteriaceae bacterium]|nr:electron transfer flavoprotein subunit beta [Microbacteriaceae bacterium]